MSFFTLREDLPCHNCIHRIDKETCKAYPNGIPEEFNNGTDIHVVKHSGQTGDFLLETTEKYEKKMAGWRAEADREGQERRARGERRTRW